jgi:excisionase family DNA binding protein
MRDDLLDVEEVAEYLGVGQVTIYRWCREGRLSCLKLGKSWRIRRDALDGFLQQSMYPSSLSEELRSFLTVLPAHIAIIDRSGTIVAVNDAWRDFARDNEAIEQHVAEGANYLRICDSATGEQSEYAAAFAEGIRSVISGQRGEFAMEYPCHSPTEWRWFVARVTSFPADGHLRAVITHENISERKRTEEQLERQTRKLAETRELMKEE